MTSTEGAMGGVALAPLPMGTLTFLMTDLEGSTALWEQHEALMRRVLSRHDALLDALITQHGGQRVRERGEGDSIFAVFRHPDQAVAAALAIARTLQAEPWPAETPLRVRLALHTGSAELRAGDYYGPVVNRCARIRGLGHGGQILLSSATAALVHDVLPAGTSLRALGAYRLKGLAQAEEIYQLLHPELPSEFPPLLAAAPQVYVCFAQPDRPLVARLSAHLEARGVSVWSAEEDVPPGTPSWEQALRDAIRAAALVLVVASPHTRRARHVADELRVAELYGRPVLPLWVAGEQWIECIPLGWGGVQYLDARRDDYAASVEQIVAAVQAAGCPDSPRPASGTARLAPGATPRNPFKGLRAFGEHDAGDFFGREGLIGELLAGVGRYTAPGAARFLAVVGPSGSGKSSAVLAGLLPHLRAGGVSGSARWVYLDPLLPGAHPLESLAVVLTKALPGSSLSAVQADLDASERGLHLLARRLAANPATRVVLVVDQAEELFTLAADEEERRQFIDLLVTAAAEPQGPVLVVLTLRADFYDRPMSYIQLGRLVDAQSIAVLPLGVAELRAAIEGPARLPDVGLRFEGELVGDLLYEVREQAGSLPLLQFTLDQLFERRAGHLLTEAAYQELGACGGRWRGRPKPRTRRCRTVGTARWRGPCSCA